MAEYVRWRRLSTRLIAWTVGVVAPSLGLLVWAGLHAQERHLLQEVIRGAALLSDTISRSAHQDMLEDRREDVYREMAQISHEPGIEKVRIFNKEGRITYSTDARESGSFVDKRAESCYACHAAGQPIVRLALPTRSRIYRSANGHRVLAMVTPIYNEPSCSQASCHAHPAGKRVLGVVDVGLSLAEIDRDMARLGRRTALVGLLAVVVLAAGMGLLARRLVVDPVSELAAATHRIAEGDLDHPIPVRSSDEIGALAQSFNAMLTSLAEAQKELSGLMAGLEQQVSERTSALRAAEAQLAHAEKMASLGRLSASIAHEINNPLTGILTFSKVLIRSLEEPGDLEPTRERCLKNLRMVQRETERCTAIVSNLLDFARQKPLARKDLDLGEVVDEALSLVQHQLELKGIAVEKSLPPLPRVHGDPGQLRQAFVNVIINAADAMTTGGRLWIVATQPDPGRVAVEFGDTGAGIPPEVLDRVFDPFFSTKEKGTGLGLSVVYGIVQRHGGEVRITSEAGKGTRVRMSLPVTGGEGSETA